MQTVEFDPDKVMQMIGTNTYRMAFDHDIGTDESRLNMLAWCEEWFNLDDNNDIWQMVHMTGQLIQSTRDGLNEIQQRHHHA